MLLIPPSGWMLSCQLHQMNRTILFTFLLPKIYDLLFRLLSPKGPLTRQLQLGESLLYHYKIQWIPSLLIVRWRGGGEEERRAGC
jgi:hypothetical protein